MEANAMVCGEFTFEIDLLFGFGSSRPDSINLDLRGLQTIHISFCN